MTTARAILQQIEALGYAVSVHRMREYVELHAVALSGDEIPHVARCEGDGDEATYQAACALAGDGGGAAGGIRREESVGPPVLAGIEIGWKVRIRNVVPLPVGFTPGAGEFVEAFIACFDNPHELPDLPFGPPVEGLTARSPAAGGMKELVNEGRRTVHHLAEAAHRL
jgi:hypothetical protein